MAALEKIVSEHLPDNIGVEWSGLSYQQKHETANTGMVLGLAFLFVFLVLAAQYESWSIPMAVIMSLPVAGLGAYAGVWLCGLENNVYFQIGLVMLVGLVAKNAILIVEFAIERRRTGMSIVNAAIQGASARLRPILMTSLAMIIGLLPLMFASGAGANGNRALGTGSIGGMLIGMILQVLIVPALFVIFQKIQEKFTPLKWEDTDNEGIENEIEQYSAK